MLADPSRVNVAQGLAIYTGLFVSHHRFPEIRAEGSSATAAAARLRTKLNNVLDTALTPYRREAVEQAIADVQAFVDCQE